MILVYVYQKLDDPIYYYIWLGEYILHKTNYTLKDLVDADNLNCKYLQITKMIFRDMALSNHQCILARPC